MKRIFNFIFLLFICSGVFAQQALPGLIQKIENSIFTVLAMDKNGRVFSQGSGFFIDETGVGITNFHVLDEAYKAQIKLKDGTCLPITSVIDYNRDADLVKFHVDKGSHFLQALRIVTNIPQRGTEVINLSSPMGLEQSISTGIVSAVREDKHGKIIQMTAPISPGSSGSPIVNKEGNVLGVATFHYKGGQNLNFAVSSIEINKLHRNLNTTIYKIWNNPLETESVKKAISLRNEGDMESSISLLLREIEKNPKNHLAFAELAFTFNHNGDNKKAFEAAIHACNIDSLNGQYHNLIGIIASNISDALNGDQEYLKLALTGYIQSIKLAPENSVTYSNLALLIYKSCINKLFSEDLMKEALNNINFSIQLNPIAESYVIRAKIKVRMKDIGGAILDCDKALYLDEEYAEAYFIRGDTKAFELLDYYGGLIDVEKALSLVDYNYTNPNQLSYYKGDMLAIKAEIYLRLFLKEKDVIFWNKAMNALDEAYNATSNQYYLDKKNYYIKKFTQ